MPPDDVDTWLADGPARYPIRDFLNWAAEHHHCPSLLVPALGRTTGSATDADERWALVALLLNDNTRRALGAGRPPSQRQHPS